MDTERRDRIGNDIRNMVRAQQVSVSELMYALARLFSDGKERLYGEPLYRLQADLAAYVKKENLRLGEILIFVGLSMEDSHRFWEAANQRPI